MSKKKIELTSIVGRRDLLGLLPLALVCLIPAPLRRVSTELKAINEADPTIKNLQFVQKITSTTGYDMSSFPQVLESLGKNKNYDQFINKFKQDGSLKNVETTCDQFSYQVVYSFENQSKFNAFMGEWRKLKPFQQSAFYEQNFFYEHWLS